MGTFAPTAQATYDPIGSGRTKLLLDKRFVSALKRGGVELTAKGGAKRKGRKLPFKAGQRLGNLISVAQPSLATILPQGRASISLDPAFASKMDSLFVSVNPIFPAEHPGAFTFPIVLNGSLAPDGTRGTLRTGGSLEFLQLGAGQVFQDELWLDLGARSDSAEVDVEPTPAFPGKLGRIGAYELGAYQVASDPKARTISLSGPLVLTAVGSRCGGSPSPGTSHVLQGKRVEESELFAVPEGGGVASGIVYRNRESAPSAGSNATFCKAPCMIRECL